MESSKGRGKTKGKEKMTESNIEGKKEQGILVLNNAIASCTESIEQHKGKLLVKEAPRAVSERVDKLLAEHIAKLRQENEEVSSDEDSEKEEDTGMGEVDAENNGTGIT